MEKMTIVKQYEAIIEKAKGVLSQGELDFLKQRAELHAKKNASRKPTKAQAENEAIKTSILEFMEVGKSYTITEIQKAMGIESNQKTSALVRQLKDNDLVVRSEVKGKAYFSLA
jgi:hypothetical protein